MRSFFPPMQACFFLHVAVLAAFVRGTATHEPDSSFPANFRAKFESLRARFSTPPVATTAPVVTTPVAKNFPVVATTPVATPLSRKRILAESSLVARLAGVHEKHASAAAPAEHERTIKQDRRERAAFEKLKAESVATDESQGSVRGVLALLGQHERAGGSSSTLDAAGGAGGGATVVESAASFERTETGADLGKVGGGPSKDHLFGWSWTCSSSQ